MPDDLTTLTTPRLLSPHHFEATFPEGWQQGRGAFGGLVIATLVRALEASEPAKDRSLRSLTAEICGPVLVGPAAITTEILRRGTGVTTLAARLTQGSEVLAHAVAVLGRPRGDRPRRAFLPPPSPPPWRDVSVLPPPPAATFANLFEFRCVGPLPFSGGAEPIASGWVRSRNPGPARDSAYLAALIDTFWPALFSIEPAPRPMGTIAFTFQIAETTDGLDPDAPLFLKAYMLAEHEGYTVEQRELWGEDGRLLALNQQTFAVIR